MKLFSKKEPIRFEARDKQIICSHCENEYFWKREAQLNTAVASFFNLDWTNRTATCLVCSECGCIQWFMF